MQLPSCIVTLSIMILEVYTECCLCWLLQLSPLYWMMPSVAYSKRMWWLSLWCLYCLCWLSLMMSNIILNIIILWVYCAECCLCWLLLMLTVAFAVLMLTVAYAVLMLSVSSFAVFLMQRFWCWVFLMLSVVILSVIMVSYAYAECRHSGAPFKGRLLA